MALIWLYWGKKVGDLFLTQILWLVHSSKLNFSLMGIFLDRPWFIIRAIVGVVYSVPGFC